jgi:hypothetical protein
MKIISLTYFEGKKGISDNAVVEEVRENPDNYLKPNFIDVDNWYDMGDILQEIVCANSHCVDKPTKGQYQNPGNNNVGCWNIKYK